jgi:hypothetical protein
MDHLGLDSLKRCTRFVASPGSKPSDVIARRRDTEIGRAGLETGPPPEHAHQRGEGTIPAATLEAFLSSRVSLSPDLRFIEIPCAVDDIVQLRTAIVHPSLERCVAFLEGLEIVPLLRLAPLAHDLGQVLALWSAMIPAPTAARIAIWLRQKGILRSDSRD